MKSQTSELRQLKAFQLLISKGKGKATYYVPGKKLSAFPEDFDSSSRENLNTPPANLNTPPSSLNTPPADLNTPPPNLSTPPFDQLEVATQQKINELGKRINDPSVIQNVISEICENQHFSSTEIAEILGRREDYVKRKYLSPMIKSGELVYLHPEMINHPEQAYTTSTDHKK